jgi:DNA replication initiation complex subunit (GINS family)
MPSLPDNFHPKYRRYLAELKKEAARNPEKMRDYDKAKQLIQDIVNSRLKKLIAIASASSRTEQIIRNLTGEERFLFEQLYRLVGEWRTQILEHERAEE